MKSFAAATVASQPLCSRLPLPSKSKRTSSVLLQLSGNFGSGTGHRFILQFLYCKRFKDHSPAHFPSPSASASMNFWRFLVPPSQSLEQEDHFVQAESSQSFSHA